MDEELWAYCGKRALTRKSTTEEPRHAVDFCSRISGALDAVCGKRMIVEAGAWDSEHPKACPTCVAVLAATSELAAAA